MNSGLPEGCRVLDRLGEGIFVVMREGNKAVYKTHPYAGTESRMLRYLAPFLPVPEVLEEGEGYLLMEYIPSDTPVDEVEAAAALSALHAQQAEQYGLGFDTTIGPFPQSNRRHDSWTDFYRIERVMPMARGCLESGRIDTVMMGRIENLCKRMEAIIPECRPSLLHGDIWSGNVIGTRRGVRFIDPAIYYGDHEMELAFITMFHTFSTRFFDAYREHRPIAPGFFQERAALYRLYPVLVHVRAFGSGYLPMLEEIVQRFTPRAAP